MILDNNSSFDGRNTAPNEADLNAVAVDKQALLPGQPGTFANVTSYVRGINGLLVELRNLAPAANLTAADFQFKAGNVTDPGRWTAAPAPAQVVTLRSPIPEAPARVLVTWADGAIANTWLQVTVLSNGNTGLRSPDVFYFGNLVGETGNVPGAARVDALDVALTRSHLRNVRWWHPSEFAALAEAGRELGFAHVEAGPLVRSSYHAREAVSRKEHAHV